MDSTDPARLYRGYIAIDDIDLQPGTSCIGFCNFAGGFCDWANDAEDDFDWTIVSLLSISLLRYNIYKYVYRVVEVGIPQLDQQWIVRQINQQLGDMRI